MKHIHNRTRFVIFLSLACLVSCKPAQAGPCNPVKKIALVAAVAGGGYLCSKGGSKLLVWGAQKKYKEDISLLHGFGYEELKKKVRIAHETNFWGAYGKYRNYPLLKYKKKLDWYLWWLCVASLCNLFSKTGEDIKELLQDLRLIHGHIAADSEFIKQRRRFEERQEDQILMQRH